MAGVTAPGTTSRTNLLFHVPGDQQGPTDKTPPTPSADRQQPPSASSNNTNTGAGAFLSSNNPFRNRAASPTPPNANTNSTSPQPRQSTAMSKNPFLDASEVKSGDANGTSSGLTADIFKDLSLLDKPLSNGAPPNRAVPPPRAGTLPPPGHRPMGSDDRRGPPRPPGGPGSPNKRDPRPRPRGMSESSAMDEKERDRREARRERPERTESEERRRRERRKEREERHRREKEKIRNGGSSSGGKLKKPTGLDIIDKLDVTGIYGQGLFHHDGPFDACNPHRNARKDRKAPMQAFPEGSANMMLGGSGPMRSRIDLDKFHGRGEEGFTDYAVTRKPDTAIMNPTDRVEQVHGDETHGLGTSTFLEGAPASRTAMQRRESEDQGFADSGAPNAMGGGLTRKKSLAQRIRARGMSATRGGRPPGIRSPESRYQDVDSSAIDTSPPQNKAMSAGGPLRAKYNKENEVNPFDNEYDSAFEKKGTQIRIAEQEKPAVTPGASTGRPRAPSSPKGGMGMGLVRSVTADSSSAAGRGGFGGGEEEKSSGGGGFLNRMRSLKGPRRTRPDRRDT